MTDTLLAWHFSTGTLRDGAKVRSGRVYRLPRGQKPILCERGFHASERALNALRYAPGPIVSRVELRGTILFDTDKAVATERKVLWCADAATVLHEFACWCAERGLRAERKAGREPDRRSWEAVRVKRAWLVGRATDGELTAATAAAWAAATAAAWAAATAAEGAAEGAAARAAATAAQSRKLTRVLGGLHER